MKVLSWSLALLLCSILLTYVRSQTSPQPDVGDLDGPDAGSENGEEEEYDYKRPEEPVDPCLTKECPKGMECETQEDYTAKCICQTSCPPAYNQRMRVCNNRNETVASLCEMERQNCMCKNKEPGCNGKGSARLKHYGACQYIAECTQDEKDEFPLRIRRWMTVTMFDLAGRGTLGQAGFALARGAIGSDTPWINPTLWKFCDLDVDEDGEINGEELEAITVPMMVIEHCITDFLKDCGGGGGISLAEWGECMGLEKDQVKNVCGDFQRERQAKEAARLAKEAAARGETDEEASPEEPSK
ncbi:SPARC-like [Tubulanus polymorphus]|uniref:SPARC-like n=1 Tax=Tubulanus polymorphus TaxID=672921 RepID=UPI003DA30671